MAHYDYKKNINLFTVMKMNNKNRVLLSQLNNEEEAAVCYDILQMIFNGLNAKTNFKYRAAQVGKIYKIFGIFEDKDLETKVDALANMISEKKYVAETTEIKED